MVENASYLLVEIGRMKAMASPPKQIITGSIYARGKVGPVENI